jgi:lactate dehydrogenase-like 2-hydroxyacid dehydrogenase
MNQISVLLTCPPMINNFNNYLSAFEKYNIKCTYPKFTQTMSEEDLIKIVGEYDAWIAGDDPATYKVLETGSKGKLKALIKWGVGIDNVDQEACKKLGLYFTHTPAMFGEEVSDVAVGYLLMLNRKLHEIDRQIKNDVWFKFRGNSLYDKKVCVVGFGDIGKCVVRKLHAFNMNIFVSDPLYGITNGGQIFNKKTNEMIENKYQVSVSDLDNCMTNADYVIVTCNLNNSTHYLVNKKNMIKCKNGVKLINVARGPVVKEDDIIELLESKHISSVGFDVFETEPLSKNNKLRNYPDNIFGSHNSSNTNEAVDKTSFLVIDKIAEFFNRKNKPSKL